MNSISFKLSMTETASIKLPKFILFLIYDDFREKKTLFWTTILLMFAYDVSEKEVSFCIILKNCKMWINYKILALCFAFYKAKFPYL